MDLQLGWVYKFIFKEGFEKLNSVYTLVKTCTYDELLSDGFNLFDYLYSLVDKSREDLENDIDIYRQEKILKLVSVIDSSIFIFVPISILKEVPIFNVKQYSKLVVTLNIGTYPKEEELTYIKNLLQEQLSATLGYTNAPDVISISKQWLTDDEYNSIITDRENTAKKIINYFSENVKLREEITKLKSILKAYEDILKQAAQ